MSTEAVWHPKIGSQWTSRVYKELWEVERIEMNKETGDWRVVVVNPTNRQHLTAVGLSRFLTIFDPKYDDRMLRAWKNLAKAYNDLEDLGQNMTADTEDYPLLAHYFQMSDYSLQWNSKTARWELVSETDYAPDVN